MTVAEVDTQLQREFADVARSSGCELLDCEFKGGTLRLVIDRPEGVSLGDCQSISKQISAILDVADFGSGRYLLEVSSPGLDRKFYKQEDYERFRGRRVRVTWRDPGMPRKRTDVGTLEDYLPESEEIVLTASDGGERLKVSLKSVEIARLEPEL